MEPGAPVVSHGVHRHTTGIVIDVPAPKVTVIEPSDPPWIHYGVPFAAFVAAAFAVLTFVRMQRQIDLAVKQIDLANRQIEQQEKALRATLEDLAITSQQAAAADDDRAKLPSLRVQVSITPRPAEKDEDEHTLAFIELQVANYGRAAANNVHVVFRADSDDMVQSQDELAKYRSENQPRDDNERYIEFQADSFGRRSATVFDRNLEVLPNQEPARVGQGWFYVRAGLIEMQWHVICRQGEFPARGIEGTVRQNLQW